MAVCFAAWAAASALLFVALALLAGHGSHAAMPVLLLTVTIWLSLIAMIVIGAMVGPDHGPNPHVPWIFGWVNRLMMVAYSFWMIVVAGPMAL